jgi:hypothetical protein
MTVTATESDTVGDADLKLPANDTNLNLPANIANNQAANEECVDADATLPDDAKLPANDAANDAAKVHDANSNTAKRVLFPTPNVPHVAAMPGASATMPKLPTRCQKCAIIQYDDASFSFKPADTDVHQCRTKGCNNFLCCWPGCTVPTNHRCAIKDCVRYACSLCCSQHLEDEEKKYCWECAHESCKLKGESSLS